MTRFDVGAYSPWAYQGGVRQTLLPQMCRPTSDNNSQQANPGELRPPWPGSDASRSWTSLPGQAVATVSAVLVFVAGAWRDGFRTAAG